MMHYALFQFCYAGSPARGGLASQNVAPDAPVMFDQLLVEGGGGA